VGKPGKVVKKESRSCRKFSLCRLLCKATCGPGGNTTTRYCIFFLDTTSPAAQNPRNFFREWFTVNGKIARHSRGGKACSICRDGLCSALIRSAPLAATGCGHPTPVENFAAIAALRSAMFRLRWARACGCARVHWVVTVHRAARRGDCANRRGRPSGPLVPATPGRAVPASSTGTLPVRVSPLPAFHALPTIAKCAQARVPVLPNQHLKWGERPVGEPAARGAWANSRGMLLGRNYRERSPGPIKLK